MRLFPFISQLAAVWFELGSRTADRPLLKPIRRQVCLALVAFASLLPLWAVASATAPPSPQPELYTQAVFRLTELMVSDVAAPTVAARNYAYATLAAQLGWEVANGKPFGERLLSKTNYAGTAPSLTLPERANPAFVSLYALLKAGEGIMPSGAQLKADQEALVAQFVKNKWLKKKEIAGNVLLAEQVAGAVVQLAKADGYLQLSTYTRYSPQKEEGHWYPTPPAYMPAVDPEWRTLKTFFIQNKEEFAPAPPAPFNLEEGSSFRQQLNEVYEIGKGLTAEQKLIANFWDCNPFMVGFSGHMAMGVKKISPGGHWIGITGIAAQKAGLSWEETLYIHALVGMSLHDAFVSCWKEKYQSDRIRPESAINKYLDQQWRPLLQTPPFPEYTSGHSVISTVSAHVLTQYFGDGFSFVDTSEVLFGLPERSFNSFLEASREAAISRLYGGIHFRDAIEEGVKQGEKIGQFIIQKTR